MTRADRPATGFRFLLCQRRRPRRARRSEMTFPSSMPLPRLCGWWRQVTSGALALLRALHPSVNVIPSVEFKVRASDAVLIETRRMSTEELEQWRAKFTGNDPGQILPLRRGADGRLAGAPKPKATRPIYRPIGLGWWQHTGWLTADGLRLSREAADAAFSAAPILTRAEISRLEDLAPDTRPNPAAHPGSPGELLAARDPSLFPFRLPQWMALRIAATRSAKPSDQGGSQ